MKKVLSLLVVFSILFSFSVAFADIIAPTNVSGNSEEVPAEVENVSGEDIKENEAPVTVQSGEQTEVPETVDTVVEETKSPSPIGGIVAIVVVVIIVALVILVSRGN